MTTAMMSTTLMAQQPELAGKTMKPAHECRIEGLTPDQHDAIMKIKTEVKQQNQQLKADLAIKKAELNKILIAEKPNEKDADKKIEEMGSIKTQIAKNKTHGDIKISALLTPAQRLQYDTKKDFKKHSDKSGQKMMHKQGEPCQHGNNR